MKTEELLFYLISSVVNERDIGCLNALDSEKMSELFSLAARHQVIAIVAMGLKKACINNAHFERERMRSISKSVNYRRERTIVFSELEKKEIWYMPMKGIILEQYYPQIGLREMCDNDVLYDCSRMDDVQEIMLCQGYEALSVGEGYRDTYSKFKELYFEMHRALFDENTRLKACYRYYRDVKKKLVKDDINKFCYHFTSEDFYIYMIAHVYKHFTWAGTGLRSLLDIYLYLEKESGSLNWPYIVRETGKMKISGFERQVRVLAQKVFSEGNLKQLTSEEKEMLQYFINAGAYGIKEYLVQNGIKRMGIFYYVFSRILPPMKSIKKYYPFFYRYKIFLPFLPVFRVIKRQKSALEEMRLLFKHKD